MTTTPPIELDCLHDLVAGKDVWGDFWALFGCVITEEAMRCSWAEMQLVDDVFQKLALRLLANDYQVVRDYLQNPRRDSFAAMVRTITRRLLIDEWRQRKRRGELMLLDRDTREAVSHCWDTDPAQRELRQRKLEALFLKLADGRKDSETYRIMYLRFVEERSVNSIGKLLGHEPNAVSHRIRYYLRKLRTKHAVEVRELTDG